MDGHTDGTHLQAGNLDHGGAIGGTAGRQRGVADLDLLVGVGLRGGGREM